MSRMHLYRPVTDAQGNLRTNATVRLIDPVTSGSITTDIFDDPTALTTLSNPFVVADGIIDVWFDDPLVLNVGVVPQGGVQETLVEGIYPDGVNEALALRNTDAVAIYTTTQPLRSTVTTDPLRRVRWVGPTQPAITVGYAIDGLDVWERTT